MFDIIPPWFTLTAFAVIGACIGSFLNVLIYRAPRGISINNPSRSFCPSCKTQLPWHLNIPICSWIFLGGKCHFCKKKISFRYCLVELAVALLFLVIAWTHLDYSLITSALLCLWAAVAIAIIFIDANDMIVFPSHTALGAILGLIACMVSPNVIDADSLLEGIALSITGAISGYLLIRIIIELGKLSFGKWHKLYDSPVSWELVEPNEEELGELTLNLPDEKIAWGDLCARAGDRAAMHQATMIIDGREYPSGTWLISCDALIAPDGTQFRISDIKSARGTLQKIEGSREAMGYGDAWIMMMIGALCGWQGVLFCIFIGSILGLIVALISRCGFGKAVPFGPSLLSASIIWLLGGGALWQLYCQWIMI